jgi:hypothetical protein
MAKNKQSDNIRKKTEGRKSQHGSPEGGEDSCRCKEVAKKTPKELLKVAIDDLSFWKKIRKG